jgi:signal transduction histidine kinase
VHLDRVDLLCGALEVHSPPGEGTTIRASVPLQSTQSTFT